MTTVDKYLKHPAEWLHGRGPEGDVVVSSRIRLARNFSGYPFGERLSTRQQKEIIERMLEATKKVPALQGCDFFLYADLSELDRQFLLERHLISREHATEKGNHAALVSPDELMSIMVLEEDHLRLQSFQSGFNLAAAWVGVI